MKGKGRKLAMLFTGLVFVVSCAMLMRQMVFYQQGESVYDEAAELVELPDMEAVPAASLPLTAEAGAESAPEAESAADPWADALDDVDIAALQQVNEDVLGWITIPETNLSYPLLQGEDNDYYLNHTWQKSRNAVGSIFMDYRSSPDLSDFHTVIYGHRMNNESMFGQLRKYQELTYWQEHPRVYLVDDSGSYVYDIFSAYVADSLSTYQIDFEDDEERQEFLDYCASRTWIDTGIVPGPDDRIITLSTCTGSGHDTRWVVHAVQVK